MKTLLYISVFIILTLGSCTSTLYTGAEYDDLYYTASDNAVAKTQSKDKAKGVDPNQQEYYDNKYATDTLFADQYSDAVDIDNQLADNGGGNPYEYYDGSYSERLRRFQGNYFDPYWRDPFYFGYGYGYGYPSYGYGYGYGYPYYGDYYGGYYPYYGGYYGGMYGGYYGGFYGGGIYIGFGGYYGGYYPPYYGGYYPPYYGGYPIYSEGSSVAYGRRERPSTMSSKWNDASGSGSSGRGTNYSAGGAATGSRRASDGAAVNQALGADTRRQPSSIANTRTENTPNVRSQAQAQVRNQITQQGSATNRRAADARPEYSNSNRSYTPSYSNPRMSTRPSYNNSRVTESGNADLSRSRTDAAGNRSYTNPGSVRTPSGQAENFRNSSQGFSNTERRVISPSGSSGQYSVPTRRSAESGSGFSSGSSNSSNSSYSGGRSSSTYNSGSSSGSSGGSYSSGSSSRSSSGSSSGSPRSSSGGRR